MQDLILPIGILGALGALVVPIPAWGIDLLVLVNILVGLILLSSVFCSRDALSLSVLPTSLLLATLLRLSVNISTTRTILSEGKGGQIIEYFGSVALGGSVLIGIIVFAIISVVQCVVVAKGSERVAEVSARFALDAMPGRQMSIDADVRAGIIDGETARRKRAELQSESRLFGALDGAMKFIKGDAIATLVIAVINFIGGLVSGMVVHGMTGQRALEKFSLLTVGDGLASQASALMCSIAAGIMVTKVEQEGESLSTRVLKQLFGSREVRLLVAGAFLILTVLPGTPTILCGIVGVLFLSSSLPVFLWSKKSFDNGELNKDNVKLRPLPLFVWKVNRNAEGVKEIRVEEELEKMRWRIFECSGVLISPIYLQDYQGSVMILRDTPIGEATTISEVEQLIINVLPETVDDITTRRLIDYYDRELPELITSIVPSLLSITQITAILRALVEEQVSIRRMDIILQALAEHVPTIGTGRALLEEVRVALRRTISNSLLDRYHTAIEVADPIDLHLRKAEVEGVFPDANIAIQFSKFLEETRRSDSIVICSRGARAMVRHIVELTRQNIPVIAREELVGIPLRTVAVFKEEVLCGI